MKYLTKKIILLAALVVLLFAVVKVSAQTVSNFDRQTQAFAGEEGAGFTDTRAPKDIREIAAQIINVSLSILGILLVIYLIYGGFLIMTSAGVQEKMDKGKKVIRNAVIGVALVLMSYGIARLVFRMVTGDSMRSGTGIYIEEDLDRPDDPLGDRSDEPMFCTGIFCNR